MYTCLPPALLSFGVVFSVGASSNSFVTSHVDRRISLDEGCMLVPVHQHSGHICCASKGPGGPASHLSEQRGHAGPQLGDGQLQTSGGTSASEECSGQEAGNCC